MSFVKKGLLAVYGTFLNLVEFANSTLYDTFISNPITAFAYEKLAQRLNSRDLQNKKIRILDVGVGTGVSLYQVLNQFPKEIEILGIDIDHAYLSKAEKIFKNHDKVKIKEKNFYEMNTEEGGGKFDIVVFSYSFMLLDKQQEAIEIAKSLLEEGGLIYFMLALDQKPVITDKLKYLTSIDFHIEKESEFEEVIKEGGLKTMYKDRLKKVGNFQSNLLKLFIYETQIQQQL